MSTVIEKWLAGALRLTDRPSSILTMTGFHAGGGGQSVALEGRRMKKLLHYIVHTLEIFMWEKG